MAKRLQRDVRYDFRGGLNRADQEELLAPNELVEATNCRIQKGKQGGLFIRAGSRRLHQTSLGAAVTGIHVWKVGGNIQIVAVADGDINYRNNPSGDYAAFSNVVPATALGSSPPQFAAIRNSGVGTPLYLYLATGATVQRWDGSAITNLSGGTAPPSLTHLIAPYHLRGFYVDTSQPQDLVWSGIADPEDITAGTRAQGGQAKANVGTGADLTALETVGSSLLFGTRSGIARFTGYSADDIQMQQDTEGIDTVNGPLGPNCLLKTDKFAAMIAEEGPFAVNEAESVYLGEKVEPDFDALSKTLLESACIGFHTGRREIWFAVSAAADSSLNKTVYIYSLDQGSWIGKFTFPFGIQCMTSWRDSTGASRLIAGCSDGFIRDLDIGVADDVLWDGSGGSTYTMTVEPAPHYFDNGPGAMSTTKGILLQGVIPVGASVTVKHAFDAEALASATAISGSSASQKPYRRDFHNQGDKLRLQFVVTSGYDVEIRGYTIYAFDMMRPVA